MKRLLPVLVLTAASTFAGLFQFISFKVEVLFW
jgi:hypothetical protein